MGLVRNLLKLLPHKDIVKNGKLYLRRHYLSPRMWKYRVFLHLINEPDSDVLHDHPWVWFRTFILWGGYDEIVSTTEDVGKCCVNEEQGSLLFRPVNFVHRIIRHHKGRTWSLVLAGPTVRKWGFWTPEGWVESVTYKRSRGEAIDSEWIEDRVPIHNV